MRKTVIGVIQDGQLQLRIRNVDELHFVHAELLKTNETSVVDWFESKLDKFKRYVESGRNVYIANGKQWSVDSSMAGRTRVCAGTLSNEARSKVESVVYTLNVTPDDATADKFVEIYDLNVSGYKGNAILRASTGETVRFKTAKGAVKATGSNPCVCIATWLNNDGVMVDKKVSTKEEAIKFKFPKGETMKQANPAEKMMESFKLHSAKANAGQTEAFKIAAKIELGRTANELVPQMIVDKFDMPFGLDKFRGPIQAIIRLIIVYFGCILAPMLGIKDKRFLYVLEAMQLDGTQSVFRSVDIPGMIKEFFNKIPGDLLDRCEIEGDTAEDKEQEQA